jgi:hypothetical protein
MLDFKEVIQQQMQEAPIIGGVTERFENCKAHAIDNGLVMEFGVYSGETIKSISQVFDGPIYGFDSWQGLPEDADNIPKGVGGSYYKGAFKADRFITDNPNLILIDGWFEDTLPLFTAEHKEVCRFIHVDSDNYNSAKDIFNNLHDRIVTGTIIQFDEFACHEAWEYREFRAFKELVEEFNLRYECIHRCRDNERVAFKITRN